MLHIDCKVATQVPRAGKEPITAPATITNIIYSTAPAYAKINAVTFTVKVTALF